MMLCEGISKTAGGGGSLPYTQQKAAAHGAIPSGRKPEISQETPAHQANEEIPPLKRVKS